MYQHENKSRQSRKPVRLIGLFWLTVILGLSLAACAPAPTVTPTPLGQTSPTSEATAPSVTTAAPPGNPTATATARVVPTVAPNNTPTPRLSQDQLESNTVAGVVKKVNPAVVTVYNKAKVPVRSGSTRPQPTVPDGDSGGSYTQGVGSGVIISTDGYILTNAHVVEDEAGLVVAFNDGAELADAKLIGADALGDVAIIKVDVKVPAVAPLGDSTKLELGETVVAIGAALGNFRNSVSKGVVSGLNRTIPGDTSTNVYIQTDAPINSGNSGGPLVNLKGEVIGINTAVVRNTNNGITLRNGSASAEGLGFAIPSNTAKLLSDQLIKTGKVSRPYFGISYSMITPAIAGTTQSGNVTVPKTDGAWVSSLVAGGPAEKAGMRQNDVITAINGEALNDNNPLSSVVLKYKAGDTVKLTLQRGDRSLTVDLTFAERPATR
jgi:2-alkenal reductase